MKRFLLRSSVLGLILASAFISAPAYADNATIQICYSGDSPCSWSAVPAAGKIVVNYTASTGPWGFKDIEVRVLSKNGYPVNFPDPADHTPTDADGNPAYCSTGSTAPGCGARYNLYFDWNTVSSTPYNGSYTFRVEANDNQEGYQCPSGGTTVYKNCMDVTVRVNNPATPATWAVAPTATTDGSGNPIVKMSWNWNGNEPDLREFQVFRSGNYVGFVQAQGPGQYDFTDSSFPSSGYGGTYRYQVAALRSSPVGSNYRCQTGSGSSCVGSVSSTRSASVVEPKPTETSAGGGGSGGGTGPTIGPTGFRPPPGGTTIVGGNKVTRPPHEDDSFFYSGGYDPTLPYSGGTVLVPEPGAKGGGKTTQQNRLEAVGPDDNTTPLSGRLKDRSLLVPFAGGLLLFLGAVHVKRLLTDR